MIKKLVGISLGFGLGIGLAVYSSGAEATPVIFFGENLTPGGGVSGDPVTARNSFLSNLSGVGTEDFESLPTGSIGTGVSLSFPGSTGAITANLTGGGPGEILSSLGAGRFATSGTQYLETSSAQSFNIAFSDPISAFGFFGTDIGDFGGEVILTLSNGTTEIINIGNSTNAPDGSLLFFGFIDSMNSYTNIAFDNTSGDDFFGFDDMTIGDIGQITPQPLPLPATVSLFGIGLASLGVAMRRNRRKTS